jgi:hypothetical protein
LPGERRLALAAAVLTVVVVAGVGYVAWRGWQHFGAGTDPNGPDNGNTSPAALPPLSGTIDIHLWEPDLKVLGVVVRTSKRKDLRLRDDEALPLRAGDEVRVEARLNRPAYLYVFWIDVEGIASPVYPWRPGHWEERPANEERTDHLSLPRDPLGRWPIKKTRPGMETLLLVAGERPWPAGEDVPALLAGLGPQRMQNEKAVVWFENWEVRHNDREREPDYFDERQTDDPVLRTQQVLRQRLGPHCAYSCAVSFANVGR